MATFVVGDVHACADELAALLDALGPTRDDRLILVGDLLDKGPDPVGVLELVLRARAEVTLGNHDVAVREHGRVRLGRPGPPPAKRCPPYLARALDALEEAGRLEEAVDLVERLPLVLRGDGFLVVHGGLHPTEGVAGTSEKLATTLREFPPKEPGAEKWWRQWPGPELVVFGHDARQGLVHHVVGGRPRCVGVDTGCVYGGALTAYVVEQDRFERVKARRAWHPID